MQAPPKLTDRTALTRIRSRAAQSDLAAFFLHAEAIAEANERLLDVNRSFKSAGIVTGTPKIWANAFPDAQIIVDEDVLGLRNEAFDLIIHAMALHWANDPVGQLVQCKRALKPDGLFLGILPGGQTLQELRIALAQAETDVSGGLSPRIAPMAEIRDLGGLLQRAGFALPVADSMTLKASYRDAFHLMRDLRAMGETNALASRKTSFTSRKVLHRANEIYLSNFADADGRCAATFELIYLTGWAPDDSQPKPLRPGSATTRLADALGAPDPAKPLKAD